MPALLEARSLHAGYGETRVLHGIDFAVEQGGVTALLGANGAGKTTTLRAICGMVRTSGEIRFANERIDGKATEDIVRMGIAHVPDGRGTFTGLTVEENLRLGAYQEPSEAVTQERMAEIFRLFPRLAERRMQLAGTMSGGEQAMVSIGRGLMRAPKLLLIDEPSLGLSPLFVKENFNIIRKINERGISIFLVEQNVHQTLAISDYGYVLSKGRVVTEGKPSELAKTKEVHQAYFG
jgi:branched-chain amino acid transport system ATP-binding protein